MWIYLLVFLAALIVDTIPVFAPPAWTVLVLLLLTFNLNPWLVVIIGVTVLLWAVISQFVHPENLGGCGQSPRR